MAAPLISKRPIGVIVVLLGLLTLAVELVVIAVLAATSRAGRGEVFPVVGHLEALLQLPVLPRTALVAVSAALAVALLVVGIGFWRWKRWAWVGVMCLAALLLSANLLASAYGGSDYFAMFIAIILVFYINQRDVQRRFGARVQRTELPLVWSDTSDWSGG
ncbi:MAG: hypothetical protein ACRC0L_02865 [Angustibacter sp.]